VCPSAVDPKCVVIHLPALRLSSHHRERNFQLAFYSIGFALARMLIYEPELITQGNFFNGYISWGALNVVMYWCLRLHSRDAFGRT
jgi:hypothetical protein